MSVPATGGNPQTRIDYVHPVDHQAEELRLYRRLFDYLWNRVGDCDYPACDHYKAHSGHTWAEQDEIMQRLDAIAEHYEKHGGPPGLSY